ncbi:YolD-like family protein [Paenibacillus enshidis]|uniref:YolD-like family protein n=1 Tax=Paenibacillus enshidis TaxID=1458439 RepID=A0ABV5B0H7_9BACL
MTTRKRLEGNGFWESSRMMLPEHRVAINRQQREELRKQKPVLDDQEMEFIEAALSESLHKHRTFRIRLFDEYEDVELSGIVNSILTSRREIKLSVALGNGIGYA